MGKTRTPKYVVEMRGFKRLHDYTTAWNGRVPSVQALEHHVMTFVVSTYPGYVNERIGQAYGIEMPSRAFVRENKADGRVLVEWRAAMFTVLPDATAFPDVARAIQRPAAR